MHIALLATGTRGDVQPFVALGEELARRGHNVRICAHEDFRGLVLRARNEKAHGNDHWSCRMHLIALANCTRHDPSDQAWVAAASLPDFIARTHADRSRQFDQEQRAFLGCCQAVVSSSGGARLPRADVIISSQFTRASSVAVADALAVPLWSVNLLPSAPTAAWGPLSGDYPASHPNKMAFYASKSDMQCCSGFLHKCAWWGFYLKIVVATLWYTTIVKATLAFRDSLGLPKQTTDESLFGTYYTPTVFAYSNELLPCVPWDWPPWFHVTGFLVLGDLRAENTGNVGGRSSHDRGCRMLAADLERWLSGMEVSDKHGSPVCITFSSMPVDARLVDALLQALEGTPTVFLFGNNASVMDALRLKEGESKKNNGLLYCTAKADHRLLLPRCSLVVHHGGAGTSAACLFANAPSLVIPILQWSDQPGWAEILSHARCGRHVTKTTFGVDKLRVAIKDAQHLRDDCGKVCRRIRDEADGAVAAVDVILSCICSSAADEGSAAARIMSKRHCIHCRYLKKAAAAAAAAGGGGGGGGGINAN